MGIPEIIGTAFIMGAVGSLHCIGMCGPLALALPMAHRGTGGRLFGGILYNAGRIFTYAVLGLLLGVAGEFLFTPKIQNVVSVGIGLLIITFLLLPSQYKNGSAFSSIANKPMLKLRVGLSRLLYIKNYSSLFGIGMLNGLLPCGMVYMAVTSSFLTGSALNGSLFMTFFGLGTFPAMLSAVFFGSYLNQQFRFRLRKVVPVFMMMMALLLVLRGLSLGIPYISPSMPVAGTEMTCH